MNDAYSGRSAWMTFDGRLQTQQFVLDSWGSGPFFVYLQDGDWYVGQDSPLGNAGMGIPAEGSSLKYVALRALTFAPYSARLNYFPPTVVSAIGGLAVPDPVSGSPFPADQYGTAGPFSAIPFGFVTIEDLDIQ